MQKVNYTTKTPILLQNEGIGPGGGDGDDGDEAVEIGHKYLGKHQWVMGT